MGSLRITRVSIVASLFLALVVAMLSPLTARASTNCAYEDYFPSRGAVKTVANTTPTGKVYGVRLEFKLAQTEINALKCFASHVELDFNVYGFNLPMEWEYYSVYSNLPGAVHDVAASDYTDQVPGVTGIQVNNLRAEASYYATLWWSAPRTQTIPVVNIRWIPSYWAVNSGNWFESNLCHRHQAEHLRTSYYG